MILGPSGENIFPEEIEHLLSPLAVRGRVHRGQEGERAHRPHLPRLRPADPRAPPARPLRRADPARLGEHFKALLAEVNAPARRLLAAHRLPSPGRSSTRPPRRRSSGICTSEVWPGVRGPGSGARGPGGKGNHPPPPLGEKAGRRGAVVGEYDSVGGVRCAVAARDVSLASVVMGADRPGGMVVRDALAGGRAARDGGGGPPAGGADRPRHLKRGGSAVDAAIAVNAALGLMEPVSCGLGGDIYAMVWDPDTRKLWGLNGSGRAPAALTIDKVPPEKDGTIPEYSPYAWTVPGCVDGWIELHRKFGRLPLGRAAGSRHRLRQGGRPGPPGDRRELGAQRPPLQGQARLCRGLHARRPGAPRGRAVRQPGTRPTLEVIAAKGRDGFYAGPVAEALVAYSRKVGGFFSLADLAKHHSEWVEPISTTYRGYTVFELPPNGQGLAALEMLNMLEGHDLKAMGRGNPDLWHLLVETKKLAYEDRARYYADPAFAEVPVQGLLDKAYGDATGRARSTWRGRRGDWSRATPRSGTATPPSSSRPTARADGLPHPVQLHRLRLRLRRARARLRHPGSRRAVHPRGRPPERPGARQTAVPHHHPGVPRQGRRAAAWRSASWAETCSPRGTCRCCSTSWTSA